MFNYYQVHYTLEYEEQNRKVELFVVKNMDYVINVDNLSKNE